MRHLILPLVLSTALSYSPVIRGDSTSPAPPGNLSISALEAAALYSPVTTYSIFRKGKNIGRHTLTVDESNGAINIDVDSRITVRVLKIPVFKFRYKSTENWADNKLVTVTSSTTTNNETEKSSLTNSGSKSVLSGDSGDMETALLHFATNHWHIGAVLQTRLFNTIKGVESNVMVTSIGTETLLINGESIKATHYKYSGDIIAQSWYDENNRWVQLAFEGTDGSLIKYVIDSPLK